jgi:hypothetical protein
MAAQPVMTAEELAEAMRNAQCAMRPRPRLTT